MGYDRSTSQRLISAVAFLVAFLMASAQLTQHHYKRITQDDVFVARKAQALSFFRKRARSIAFLVGALITTALIFVAITRVLEAARVARAHARENEVAKQLRYTFGSPLSHPPLDDTLLRKIAADLDDQTLSDHGPACRQFAAIARFQHAKEQIWRHNILNQDTAMDMIHHILHDPHEYTVQASAAAMDWTREVDAVLARPDTVMKATLAVSGPLVGEKVNDGMIRDLRHFHGLNLYYPHTIFEASRSGQDKKWPPFKTLTLTEPPYGRLNLPVTLTTFSCPFTSQAALSDLVLPASLRNLTLAFPDLTAFDVVHFPRLRELQDLVSLELTTAYSRNGPPSTPTTMLTALDVGILPHLQHLTLKNGRWMGDAADLRGVALDASTAARLTSLTLKNVNWQLADLFALDFASLQRLEITYDMPVRLENVNALLDSLPPSLTHLTLDGLLSKTVDLRHLDKLEAVRMNRCDLTHADLPHGVKTLDLSQNALIGLRQGEKTWLPSTVEHLDVSSNSLTMLDGKDLPSDLATLDASRNGMHNFGDLTSCHHLTMLDLSYNKIHTIHSAQLPSSLSMLKCGDLDLTLDETSSLVHLSFIGKDLGNIDLSKAKHLKDITVEYIYHAANITLPVSLERFLSSTNYFADTIAQQVLDVAPHLTNLQALVLPRSLRPESIVNLPTSIRIFHDTEGVVVSPTCLRAAARRSIANAQVVKMDGQTYTTVEAVRPSEISRLDNVGTHGPYYYRVD